MASIDVLLAFLAATAVFAYVPGPAILYATAQTIARGRRAGWMAALGIHAGGYVHVAAAALGLALLLEAVPVVYAVLKVTGAVYLVWLGVGMFRGAQSEIPTPGAKSPVRAFWESVTVEVLNPKTAVFFVAFLPQFADPAAALPVWTQLLLLGVVVNLMFSSADVISVLLADRVGRLLERSGTLGRNAQRLGGGVLVGLGVNLVVNR